jgi:hypothetical protein
MATRDISPSVPVPNAIEVFCSYSHKDDHLREELETHLSILQAHGIIDSWHDHAIPAGKEWASQIDERLNSAQIILLLISPDFLASKYCREVEVKRALERHQTGDARVISILLRDVDWHGSPLSKLQALPKDAKPVTSWANRDQAFKDIAIGIRKVAEELRKKKKIATPASAPGAEVGGRTPHPSILASAEAVAVHDGGRVGHAVQPKPGKSLPGKYMAIGIVATLALATLVYLAAGKPGWTGLSKGQFRAGRAGAVSNGPVRYYAGIDLGAKGTKPDFFSLNSSKKLDGLKLDTIETKLVSSMRDGEFSDSGIREATNAVSRLLGQMQAFAEKNQMPVEYFVVGSSGLAKAKNKDALATSVKAATGIDMDFIDAKKEGYFGLLSTVPNIPKNKLDVASYVDIGSGNTKFGCLVGEGLDFANYRGGDVDFGSVSARTKGTEANPKEIKAGIDQVMHDQVTPAYSQESMDAPCLRNGELIYWTGGAAWATATFIHPEKALDSTVKIARADLDSFLSILRDGSWNQKQFQYSFPRDMPAATQQKIRDAAEKARKKITMETFTGEDMYAGVSIMKTILGSSNTSAVVTFVRDGGKFLHGFAAEKYHDPAGESAQAKP